MSATERVVDLRIPRPGGRSGSRGGNKSRRPEGEGGREEAMEESSSRRVQAERTRGDGESGKGREVEVAAPYREVPQVTTEEWE